MKTMKRVVKTSLFLVALLALTAWTYKQHVISRDVAYVALSFEFAILLFAPLAIYLMYGHKR